MIIKFKLQKLTANLYDKMQYFKGLLDLRNVEVIAFEDIRSFNYLNSNKPKVYLISQEYDYQHKNWGLSYAHYNIFLTLLNMGFPLIYFNYDYFIQKYGYKKTRKILIESLIQTNPDIIFYVYNKNWLGEKLLSYINNLYRNSLIFLQDDHFRYTESEAEWKQFNYIVTTWKKGYEKRKELGYNCIYSQWGANHYIYKPMNLKKDIDVSFIGRAYGERINIVNFLKDNGINIKTFGQGWGTTERIRQSEMVEIINRSKIVVNFSFSSKGEYLQVKGRDFEVPACRTFLITDYNPELNQYFVPGKEIETYNEKKELLQKIVYYLSHENERRTIEENGYKRFVKEHTFEQRIRDIFIRLNKTNL